MASWSIAGICPVPPGKHDWMNRTTFVGTLGGRMGVGNAVLIRVFKLV